MCKRDTQLRMGFLIDLGVFLGWGSRPVDACYDRGASGFLFVVPILEVFHEAHIMLFFCCGYLFFFLGIFRFEDNYNVALEHIMSSPEKLMILKS